MNGLRPRLLSRGFADNPFRPKFWQTLKQRFREKQEADEGGPGIIIDSREKSEQAFKNAMRAVRRPEDLNGFD